MPAWRGFGARRTWTTQSVDPFSPLSPSSVKAPHIFGGGDREHFPRAVPAPWYEDAEIAERLAPRTPNYNFTNDDDDDDSHRHNHHWLVRNQPPLTQSEAAAVDRLYVSRLKSLISVDDLVEDLVHQLEDSDVLRDTYVIFTSDNGFRLGQFRVPMGKMHPYENDVRVPMMVRGPGIVASRNTTVTTPCSLTCI